MELAPWSPSRCGTTSGRAGRSRYGGEIEIRPSRLYPYMRPDFRCCVGLEIGGDQLTGGVSMCAGPQRIARWPFMGRGTGQGHGLDHATRRSFMYSDAAKVRSRRAGRSGLARLARGKRPVLVIMRARRVSALSMSITAPRKRGVGKYAAQATNGMQSAAFLVVPGVLGVGGGAWFRSDGRRSCG